MNTDEYFKDLITIFPILKEKIEEEDSDMIHMRMEVLSDYTIDQVRKKDWNELKKCFDFQELRIEKASAELLNALTVSYCESLLLGEIAGQMKEIVPRMGTKLKTLYREYEGYYNGLAKRSMKN